MRRELKWANESSWRVEPRSPEGSVEAGGNNTEREWNSDEGKTEHCEREVAESRVGHTIQQAKLALV